MCSFPPPCINVKPQLKVNGKVVQELGETRLGSIGVR